MTKVRKAVSFIFIATILIWLALTAFLGGSLYGLNENWFYWIEFAFVIYLILALKHKSSWLLYIAFAFTVLGAAFNIIGWTFSEQILRTSFVFWLAGIVLSLKELK